MSEETKAVATRPQSTVTQFNPNDPVSLYMQTNVFEQLQRVAKLISSSGSIPAHLKDNVSDCFLVAAQAFRWGMDPFAVAQSCYVLSGKLGYEGKLIAAVVNANSQLAKKLNYEYSGSGKQRQVRVFGTLKGEVEPREVLGTVEGWATGNKQWVTMTDQMLSYRGAREWARRHMPEAVLGVYAEEELPEVVRGAENAKVINMDLDDLGVVVEAKNDGETKPKPVVIDVPVEVVEPKARKAKAEKPTPGPRQEQILREATGKDADGKPLSTEDAEIDAMFS
jgi:hypothetical protein